MGVYQLRAGHHRTMLLGSVRKPGERVEIPDAASLDKGERAMLSEHFECVEARAAAAPGAESRLRNGLTAEQARHKLRESGVAHADSVAGDELADLYEQVFAVHTGAAPAKGAPAKEARAKSAGKGRER